MRKYFETNESENNIPKLMGCSKNIVLRKIYNYKFLHQKRSQVNNQPLHLKEVEKVIKPNQSQKKIIKIGTEIDEIENIKLT